LKAENEAKEKKLKEAENKALSISKIIKDMKFTSLKAEISRNEEAVSNYKEHKEFLDKLT
jgi:hypothetical protein